MWGLVKVSVKDFVTAKAKMEQFLSSKYNPIILGKLNSEFAMPRPASAPSDVSMRENILKGKLMVPL